MRGPQCAPGELVLAEEQRLAAQLAHDFGLVVGRAVLQHVLDDVVAVLVLHESLGVLQQLLQDRRRLVRHAVLQDPLDHAAAVRVSRQRQHLAHNGQNTPSVRTTIREYIHQFMHSTGSGKRKFLRIHITHTNLPVRTIMKVMRTAYAKSGIQSQHVSNYTRQTITEATRTL